MAGWTFADVFEVVAEQLPDAPVLVHGDRRATWAEFDQRADGVAATLLAGGSGRQDKVAHYLYNCPEYLEAMFATFKAGLVPMNTNYRYVDDELVYLWRDADVTAVVFGASFAERIDGLRHRVPLVRTWLCVPDGNSDNPCPDWALDYETAATAPTPRVRPSWGRSGEDLILLYTGGTTGMPKGVMWRQHDVFCLLNPPSGVDYGEAPDLDVVRKRCVVPGPITLPAAPLMHGTGMFYALTTLTAGGSVVTLPGRTFDPIELLDTIEREGVNRIAWVGDAFCKPVLRALDASPGQWDLSTLELIISSGVMWSEESKQALIAHNPTMAIADAFSSSEALGMGASVSTAEATPSTSQFALNEHARVVTDDGRFVVPGSGEVGRIAVSGRGVPLGYYKDPAKSALSFPVIDGVRYSVPGDYGKVESDGTLTLLGRGSVCINTAGEKVYPEEVEEALKRHPTVFDAVAVGVPDERFGQAVTAVVEPMPGCTIVEGDIVAHVRSALAGFKAPRHVVVVESINRAPNGKVDYNALRARAVSELGVAQ